MRRKTPRKVSPLLDRSKNGRRSLNTLINKDKKLTIAERSVGKASSIVIFAVQNSENYTEL